MRNRDVSNVAVMNVVILGAAESRRHQVLIMVNPDPPEAIITRNALGRPPYMYLFTALLPTRKDAKSGSVIFPLLVKPHTHTVKSRRRRSDS